MAFYYPVWLYISVGDITEISDLFSLVSIRNYIEFKGRSGRREFLAYVLFTLAVIILLALAFYLASPEPGNPDAPTSMAQNIVLGAGALFMLPGIAVHMRRLHDLGQSGACTFWSVC